MTTKSSNNVEKLKQRKLELESKIKAIHADFKRGLDPDSAERAVQLENAEVLNEILRVSEQELKKIDDILLDIKQADRK